MQRKEKQTVYRLSFFLLNMIRSSSMTFEELRSSHSDFSFQLCVFGSISSSSSGVRTHHQKPYLVDHILSRRSLLLEALR